MASTAIPAPAPMPADPICARRRGEGLRSWLWPIVQATLFRWSLQNAYRFRARLLRLFGASLASEARVRQTVRIDRPWMLSMGRKSSIGDGCELWAGAPILIGARSVLSQYSLVDTWEVDLARIDSRPVARPVTIGDDVWIATESVLVAGAVVPDGVVVGARSVIAEPLEPWTIATGAPAKSRRKRPPFKVSASDDSDEGSAASSNGGATDA